jgi:hypothetical protein
MALDRIVALARAGLMRRRPGVIHRANRARDALQWGSRPAFIARLSTDIRAMSAFGFSTVTH